MAISLPTWCPWSETWVWLGWRWCRCVLMYWSLFRNFTFCFYRFLFYFGLSCIYLCCCCFPLGVYFNVCLFVYLFRLYSLLVFIYCFYDQRWLEKRLFSAWNQCNQMAISLPTWCPWSETLRNMTVGTAYREDGSEHNRF
jgi:hypothetical protein